MANAIDNEEFRNTLFSWPEVAMVLLYKNYFHSLIRIADMYTHNRQASEDVLQEIFADVWQKHKILGRQREGSIQAYLIKAVHNHAISLYRKKIKADAGEKEYFYANSESSPDYPAEACVIRTETEQFIRVILGTFPLREKQCLMLQIDHDMPVKVIAKKLGISKKSVERALTSARKRLRTFGSVLS
jgi:RNA polymerase sigma-70 factor (ECF subfamily)